MEIKSGFTDTIEDNFFYILACIMTLGVAWILRIIITQAIIKSFKKE